MVGRAGSCLLLRAKDLLINATALAAMCMEIENLAARGEPNVSRLIETSDGSIAWRERPVWDGVIAGRPLAIEGDPATWPFMAWLHRDSLIERLAFAIDAIADDANALTLEQRTDQIRKIDRDRLAIEREEEHWVSEARSAGATILRRPDADPRAVLSLSDDMPGPN